MFSGTAESRMRRMKAKRKSMPIWGNSAVVPSAWFASPGFIEMGTVEVGGANEVIPFLEVPKTCRETISSENLPSEFFSHQLMEVDSNNYEEVISFSRNGGFSLPRSGVPSRRINSNIHGRSWEKAAVSALKCWMEV